MIGIFILLAIVMLIIVKFCKKTLKVILTVIVFFITLYCIIVFIDMSRVESLKKPIFVVPVNTVDDGGTGEYKGLGYNIKMKIEFSAEYGMKITNIEMYMFNKCIAGAIE